MGILTPVQILFPQIMESVDDMPYQLVAVIQIHVIRVTAGRIAVQLCKDFSCIVSARGWRATSATAFSIDVNVRYLSIVLTPYNLIFVRSFSCPSLQQWYIACSPRNDWLCKHDATAIAPQIKSNAGNAVCEDQDFDCLGRPPRGDVLRSARSR